MEKFKKFIGSNKSLYYNKGGVFISFYSNRIVDKLAEYGIVIRKSKIAKVPEQLKNNRHFWRGMIDGDGWVTRHIKTDCPLVGFCGTIDIVNSFINFTGNTARVRQKTSCCHELSYSGITAQYICGMLYPKSIHILRQRTSKRAIR